ncbi:hypothetical protein [Micromonospora costi]|uniref:Right-handed parallel beta-helix repeat-containing protein n=1 Tax=Micromonospora costi TaxID=1530042 RepID=A0A3B0A9L0_9ACTN|nr:hypothetical protein [Micromonospora costi]RKN57150.1 hypothetical protein D7193_00110 [Micromonospora costi]
MTISLLLGLVVLAAAATVLILRSRGDTATPVADEPGAPVAAQGCTPGPGTQGPATCGGSPTAGTPKPVPSGTSSTPSASARPRPSTATPAGTATSKPPPTSGLHGRDINAANTGYRAWTGPNGQRCTDATMKVYASRVRASRLGNATCVWLKGGLVVDRAVTLTAARIDAQVETSGTRLTLRWSTVDAPGHDYAVGGHVTAYRCQLINGSDGVRLYDTSIVESYVRVRQGSAEDHNDGVQAYRAGAGGEIIRSNIDSRPVNAPGILGTAAIFIADDSRGELAIRDNWLAGGVYTLRLHESATYRVTGNIITGYDEWPVSTSNAVPGAFLEWSGNVTGEGAEIRP